MELDFNQQFTHFQTTRNWICIIWAERWSLSADLNSAVHREHRLLSFQMNFVTLEKAAWSPALSPPLMLLQPLQGLWAAAVCTRLGAEIWAPPFCLLSEAGLLELPVKPVSDCIYLKSLNSKIQLTSAVFVHSEIIIKASIWVPSCISCHFMSKWLSHQLFVLLYFRYQINNQCFPTTYNGNVLFSLGIVLLLWVSCQGSFSALRAWGPSSLILMWSLKTNKQTN